MLRNNYPNNLDQIIDSFSFNKSVNHDIYDGHFYDHITSLLKFKLLDKKSNNNVDFKLNERNYLGLEQYIMENTKIVENDDPCDIDWDLVDDLKDKFKLKINKVLKTEAKSEFLKPFIRSTLSSFENWVIYKQLQPNSISNPWFHTNEIIISGFLFLTSDNRDFIKEYNKKLLDNESSETQNNIFILAKSEHDKKISGVLVDNRFNAQTLVYNYLLTNAVGSNQAKNLTKIKEFLSNRNKRLTDQQIKDLVLLPLKRAGLIGSSTQGYYLISNYEDLKSSYQYHKEKLLGIQRTMDIYKEKAKKSGFPDLE